MGALPDRMPLHRRPQVQRILLYALIAEISFALLNISTMPVYLREERGFEAHSIGLVFMAFLLSEAALKGPMGHLADKWGPRRLLAAAPLLSVGSAVLTLFVPHDLGHLETSLLMGLRVLDGLGAAMIWPALFALGASTVADKERQGSLSLVNTCYILGVALALPVGGFAEDLAGTKSAGLYLAMATFALTASIGWFGVPRRAALHDGLAQILPSGFGQTVRQIPGYLCLAFVVFLGIGFPMAVFKLFALEEFGLSGSAFGALVFPSAVAMALMNVPMARLGERLGRHRAVQWGLFACATGLAFISLGAWLPPFRSLWILSLGGVPVGLGFLLAIPAWLAAVSDIDTRKRGSNLGAVMTAQGVGAIVGMPIGAWLYDSMQPIGIQWQMGESFGRYSPVVACCAAIVVAWTLSLKILRSDGPKLEGGVHPIQIRQQSRLD